MEILKLFLLLILAGFMSCRTPEETISENDQDIPLLWRDILEQARWAQNAHNIQSWKVEIVDDRVLVGTLDKSRLLPETDPFDRQLILSLGAFTAVAEIAASREGWNLDARWIGPSGWSDEMRNEIPLFRWELTESAEDNENSLLDTLSAATVKYAVHEAELPVSVAEDLERSYSENRTTFQFITSPGQVVELKEKALQSFKKEMAYEPTRDESIINTRYGRKQREEYPYGITLLPNFNKSKARFIEFLAAAFPQSSESYGKQAVQMFEKALEPSEALLLMKTTGNKPSDQYYGGMAMQRIWMDMIQRGYSLLPLSQGLQEYEAVSYEYEFFQKTLSLDGETVQMLWAVAAPDDGEYLRSPRLEVADIALLK